ncbi:MAG: hypothetical protein IKI74_04660 [Christensenellaceae bacterium]|nr:hypothetical protein [Christensenellaceae bacterium]
MEENKRTNQENLEFTNGLKENDLTNEDTLETEENMAPDSDTVKNPGFLKKILGILLAIIPTLLMCAFPVLFLYAKNTQQIVPIEAFVIIAAYEAIGIIVFLTTFFLSKRNVHFTAVFSFVFMALFLNFDIIKRLASLISSSSSNLIAAIMYSFILILVSFFLIKHRNREFIASIQKIVTLVIVLLTVWNLITVVDYSKIFPNRSTASQDDTENETTDLQIDEDETLTRLMPYDEVVKMVESKGYSATKYRGLFSESRAPLIVSAEERKALEDNGQVLPNFYWIILDEAGDFYTMNKYYNYDCEDFNKFLIDYGFNISYNSENRSTLSYEITSDLCSLNAVAVDQMNYAASLYYRWNAEVYYILNELGYDVYQASSEPSFMGSLYDLTNMKREEELFKSATMQGKTQLDLAVEKTPLSLFNINLFQNTVQSKRLRISRVFDYLSDPSNYTFGSSVAIVSHIMCPHSPFVYDENGTIPPRDGFYNWDIPDYYLGQYKYTEIQMKKIITALIENDPDCIIVLMSDHGTRPRSDDWVEMPLTIAEEDMRRILNAVYIGGRQLDIEGLNGVNTLRAVLQMMGADTPQIDNNPPIIANRYLKRIHKDID